MLIQIRLNRKDHCQEIKALKLLQTIFVYLLEEQFFCASEALLTLRIRLCSVRQVADSLCFQ